ncbi:MAG: erythromycin esterase family protein [Deinococcales bacterium]
MKNWLIGLLLLAGFALAQASPEVAWLQKNTIPLESTRAETGLSDLEPLGNLVTDSRMIGLGEATHGTKEFFTTKHRLLEYLVQKHGFAVFAIEANWASSFALNQYVLGATGNARDLLRQYAKIMWAWRTEEVLGLIEWMRRYNQTAKQKIIFSGFDMQEPVPAVDFLTDWFAKTLPTDAARVEDLLGCIRFSLGNIIGVARYSANGERGANTCATQIATVRQILQNRRQNISNAAYQTNLQLVRVLEQANSYYRARFVRQNLLEAVTLRDLFMAENAAWLERSTGQKVVLWAHNGHITFNPQMHFGWKPMGAYLRERYGAAYQAWGFAFFEGSFYAQLLDSSDPARTIAAAMLGLAANPSIQRVPNPPKDSFEALFRAAGMPAFILNLRQPLPAWLAQKRRLQIIGQNLPPFRAPEPDWYSYEAVLQNDFDLLIYLDKTSPSTPI